MKQRYSEEETSPPWQDIRYLDEVFEDEGTTTVGGLDTFTFPHYHEVNNNNNNHKRNKKSSNSSNNNSNIGDSSSSSAKDAASPTSSIGRNEKEDDEDDNIVKSRTKPKRDIFVPGDKIYKDAHLINSHDENDPKDGDDTNTNIDVKKNISGESRSKSKSETTELPRYYRYPVFAEGAESFTHAREDPMSCNINDDMVLLWRDVVISDDDEGSASEGARGKSLQDLTVDEVYDNLHRVVERQRKLKSQLEQTYGKRAFRFKSQESRSKRKCLQNTADTDTSTAGTDFQSHSNLLNHPNTPRPLSTNIIAYKESVHPFANSNNPTSAKTEGFSGTVKLNDDTFYVQSKIISGHPAEPFKDKSTSNSHSPVKSYTRWSNRRSDPSSISQVKAERSSSCESQPANSRMLRNKHHRHQSNSPSTRQSLHKQSNSPHTWTPDATCCSEHYHEQYTDFTFDPPVTFLLSCNDPWCPWNGLGNGFQAPCRCCPCCWCRRIIEPPIPCQKATCRCICNRSNPSLHEQLRPSIRPVHDENPAKACCVNDFLERNDFIRCGNSKCPRAVKFLNAKYSRCFKSCHHCYTTYCSKTCRRNDWFRHKTHFCYGSLVSSVCKKVVRFCRDDERTRNVLSRLARRGYLSQGRGCLLVGFVNLASAREFLEEGLGCLSLRPTYVTLKELTHSKMYGGVLDTLIALCQEYNPGLKYVLNVGIGLCDDPKSMTCGKHNHHNGSHHRSQNSYSKKPCPGCSFGKTDSPSCTCFGHVNTAAASHPQFSQSHPWNRSRHKAPILQRSVKLRLHASSIPLHEHRLTFESHWWDEYRTSGPTLILTSVPPPGSHSADATGRRSRELCLANIQRKLRHRGVNLRQQFPDVYSALISYASEGAHFPSQVLFPVDTKTGKVFTCFLMPEAEAELEWMQSHFLLDDLELSRDSINRSISESDSRSFS